MKSLSLLARRTVALFRHKTFYTIKVQKRVMLAILLKANTRNHSNNIGYSEFIYLSSVIYEVMANIIRMYTQTMFKEQST